MQNKMSLLRFFPFNCGKPRTQQAVAEQAVAEAIKAGHGPLTMQFDRFIPRLNEDGLLLVWVEVYNHLTMKYETHDFALSQAVGSQSVYVGVFKFAGREYRFNYNTEDGEFYCHPDAWISVMPRFIVDGLYCFVDRDGQETFVESDRSWFDSPWVPHSIQADDDLDPVHESLNMLCLRHSDWVHAQFLKDCPNIDPMVMANACLASSFETVDGVFYSFGTQPNVDWVYIRAIGKCVYRVVSAHNGRVVLRNEKSGRLFFCNMDEFKKEFIRTSKEWDNKNPTATANHDKHNPRLA